MNDLHSCASSQIIFSVVLFLLFFSPLCKKCSFFTNYSERPVLFFSLLLEDNFSLFSIICFVFVLYSVFNEHTLGDFITVVETMGIEPTTSWMPFKRSPKWATPPLRFNSEMILGNWTTSEKLFLDLLGSCRNTSLLLRAYSLSP